MKGIAVLGSTGSIGRSTLDVVRRHPERFNVVALAAGSNASELAAQAREFSPSYVSLLSEEAAAEFSSLLDPGPETGFGSRAAARAATFDGVDMVVSAISGAAGLVPTMAAVEAGVDVALANKETLVAAGPLVMEAARQSGARLMPVDSEHSAVFQSMAGHRREDLKRVILTASGGPFRATSLCELDSVTPEQALDHPRWSMGRRITVDSATLMNKALEVIEASFLFGLDPEMIDVAIHPQAIVHSMVEYVDGSIMAQMNPPDMRGPIAYALAYPERIESGVPALDFAGLRLEFDEPDPERFPGLAIAREALRLGGTAPAVVNAADEVAVEMFLGGAMPFTGISRVVADVLASHETSAISCIADVFDADSWARERAAELIGCIG